MTVHDVTRDVISNATGRPVAHHQLAAHGLVQCTGTMQYHGWRPHAHARVEWADTGTTNPYRIATCAKCGTEVAVSQGRPNPNPPPPREDHQ